MLPYRLMLSNLEKDILKDGGEIELAQIQHRISNYQPVMRALQRLIDQIKLRRAHGCLILDVVYKASCSGVAHVRTTLQK